MSTQTTAADSPRGYVEIVSGPKEHTCSICTGPEYKRAEEIIRRSGFKPENWGHLLHDIARELKAKVS